VPIGRFQTAADVASVEEHLNPDFPNFNTGIPDQYRLDIFLKEFESYVRNNNLPNQIVMTLCTDHTSGTSVGFPTPAEQVADNDLAVWPSSRCHQPPSVTGRVPPFSLSRTTPKPAQITWTDIAPRHSSPARTLNERRLNHTCYTQINMVRTIEELLGLPPMNQHGLLASAMTNAFEDSADVKTFAAIPSQIPLDTLNPAPKSKLEKPGETNLRHSFLKDQIRRRTWPIQTC
jgi:hypothetical protein